VVAETIPAAARVEAREAVTTTAVDLPTTTEAVAMAMTVVDPMVEAAVVVAVAKSLVAILVGPT